MEMKEKLEMRTYGDASLPTLIYLPGLHGDWTLVGSFRHALGGRVRFVEFTYPRTLTWSLDDYAANLESALARLFELIKIKSVSTDPTHDADCNAAADWLAKQLG